MNPPLPDNGGSPFRIGDVLIRSWRTFSAHWFRLIVLFIALDAPRAAVDAHWPVGGDRNLIRQFFLFILRVAFESFGESLVIDAVIQSLRSAAPLKLRASLPRVLPRYSQLFFVALAVEVGFAVGLALFIIPGLIFGTQAAVALPASVIEKTDISTSLARSTQLVRNHGWPIFGVMVGYVLIAFALYFLVLRRFPEHILISNLLTNSVAQAFYSTYIAVLYTDLRATKEGIITEPIAEIFD